MKRLLYSPDIDPLTEWPTRTRRGPGDCIIWTGATSTGGTPTISRGGYNSWNLRRVLTESRTGQPLTATQVIQPICGDLRCLAAEHLTVISRSQLATASHGNVIGGRCWKDLHDLKSEADIIVRPSSRVRQCRACYKIRNERARAKRRTARGEPREK